MRLLVNIKINFLTNSIEISSKVTFYVRKLIQNGVIVQHKQVIAVLCTSVFRSKVAIVNAQSNQVIQRRFVIIIKLGIKLYATAPVKTIVQQTGNLILAHAFVIALTLQHVAVVEPIIIML